MAQIYRIFDTLFFSVQPASCKMIDKYLTAVFSTTECVNFSQHIHEIFTKTIADIS